MSGIAGIFHLDRRPVSGEVLQKMAEAEARRGPDGRETWAQGQVGLAHCQLQATPESLHERQPLVYGDGSYAITWDGRVDNREELIRTLPSGEGIGPGTPDPGLVVAAYLTWGRDCVKHLVGDFAFALWDGPRRELFCARDPMGIRTLYYHYDGRRFIFASDIQPILEAGDIPQELNDLMVGLYLLGKYNEGEQTFYRGVFQALPANYLVIGEQGLQKQVYWEPDPWTPLRYRTTEEYVEHLREVLFQAVQCRLRGVSPVGISLSGGMDSASIACVASSLISRGDSPGTEVQALSSVFQQFPTADESEYIGKVREAWGIKGRYINADGLWGFKPLREGQDSWNRPYPIPFQARHEYLLSLARESGIRAVLTGEGGDELLNTGAWYFMDLLKGFRWGRLRQELRHVTPESRRTFRNVVYRFYKEAFWDMAPGPVKQARRRVRPQKTPQWLDDEFIRSSGALEYEPVAPPKPRSRSLYRQSQYNGCRGLPNMPFLSYITEMYAKQGVEARHPFYDRRVIEFLIRVPPHLKFSEGWSKLLLRRAMEGLLPDEVRLRPAKSHFADVLKRGVQEERASLQRLLEDGCLATAGWVKREQAGPLLARFLAGEPGLNGYLITLVTLEGWLRQQFGGNGGGDSTAPLYKAIDSGKERR